jgi:transcriptional regulator with XRE-family HTH domain
MGATSADRAARVREIRAALGVTQPEFADRLNAAAAELGLDARYTPLSISQRETDRLALDIEDYVILTHVDPDHRSIAWLAFGRDFPIKYLGMLPKPPTKPTVTPKDAGQGDAYPRRHRGK